MLFHPIQNTLIVSSSSSTRLSSTLFLNFILFTALLLLLLLLPVHASSSDPDHHFLPRRNDDGSISIPLRHLLNDRQYIPQNNNNDKRNILEDVQGLLTASSSSSSDTNNLKPVRVANLDRLSWIKNRVASKWASKEQERDVIPGIAMERANKRDILITSSSTKSRFKRIVTTKRADHGSDSPDGGGGDANAPFPPSASNPADQPATLAPTRGGRNTTAIGPASAHLIDDVVAGEDIEYMAAVSIGNPPQSFNVIVDTGSADLWVQSVRCNNCSSAPRFEKANSTTAVDKKQEFDIAYGIGSTSGYVFEDDIQVAGLKAHNQSFAVATHMSQDWTNQPASGLLGLGFQTNSKIGANPFFQTLVEQKTVPQPVFATAFGRAAESKEDHSSLILGGIDSTKYTGDITYIPVSTTRWYWQLQIDSINVLGKPTILPKQDYVKEVIIDTGSSLIAGPKEEVDAFWQTVPNATYNDFGGYWQYPCDSKVNTSISFTGVSSPLSISDQDLNFGQVSVFSDFCVGAVIPGNTSGYWILGLAFLKNYYTIFDAGKFQIGFATPSF